MPRWLVLSALSWVACATVSIGSESKTLVTVELPDDFSVSPGESKDAEIRITVTDGFHVQANPAANKFLIPLTVKLDSENDLEVGEVHYPPGEPYRLKGADQELLTYEDTFTVTVSIRASGSAKEGISKASGRIRYQACDDRVCLPPATLTFDFEALIQAAPVPR
jgi:DsbC/DsbD-like thiol-disulfide interchange protein